MKEYGGFLPLELANGYDYFDDICDMDVIPLNCGRSAFYYATKASGAKKVYLPYLNCQSIAATIKSAGAAVEYYYLNDDLTPKDIAPKSQELVMWINYYGNATEEQKQKVLDSYPNIMIDNCHAFFSPPVKGVYNCYSTRKFFGVCDGAYLIKENLPHYPLEHSVSFQRAQFLLKTIELGTNPVYPDSLENEDTVADGVLFMSHLTQRILQSIRYDDIQRIRKANLLQLHERLGHKNKFQVNLDSDTHMYYPLLIYKDDLRERVIARNIYTPTWWKHVPQACNFANLETRLSRYMLMIPMDQRYTIADMDDIADILLQEM